MALSLHCVYPEVLKCAGVCRHLSRRVRLTPDTPAIIPFEQLVIRHFDDGGKDETGWLYINCCTMHFPGACSYG